MDKTALCWKISADDLSQHSVGKDKETQRAKMFCSIVALIYMFHSWGSMLTNCFNCGTVCVCTSMGTCAYVCGYACVCRYVLVEPEDNLRCYSLDAVHLFFFKIKKSCSICMCVPLCVCIPCACNRQMRVSDLLDPEL